MIVSCFQGHLEVQLFRLQGLSIWGFAFRILSMFSVLGFVGFGSFWVLRPWVFIEGFPA